MSFMQGFAEGFNQSYTAAKQRREKQEDDMFALTYKSFLDRKEELKTQSQRDRAHSATAEQIATRYNQPLAPILDALRSGVDTSIVIDNAKSGEWSMNKAAENKPDDTAAALTPTLSAPQSPAEPQAERGFSLFGGNSRDEAYNNSVDKIAKVQGTSPDQVRQTLTAPAQTPAGPSGGSWSYRPREEVQTFDPAVAQQRAVELRTQLARGEISEEEFKQSYALEVEPSVQAESMYDAPKEDKFPSTDQEIAAMIATAETPEEQARAMKTLQTYHSIKLTQKQIEGEFPSATKAMIRQPDGSVTFGMLQRSVDGQGNPTTTNVSSMDGPQPVQEGNYIPYTPDMIDLEKRIFDLSTSTPVVQHNNQVNSAASGVRIGKQLMDMVQQDDSVLASGVSSVAQMTNSALKEVTTALKLFDNSSMEVGSKVPSNEKIQEMEKELEKISPNSVRTLADKSALFKAKTVLFIYRMGAVEGQEGRALTEGDVQRLQDMLGAGTSPEAYNRNLIEYAQSNISRLKDSSQALNDAPAINQFTQITGGINPYGSIAPTLGEFIDETQDPSLKDAFNLIEQYEPPQEVSREQPPASVPSGAVEYLKQNPNLADAFDQKYGPGAAQRILGSN